MAQPQFIEGEGEGWADPAEGYVDVYREGQAAILPVDALERVTGEYENDAEWCRWIEYHLNGAVVHRSVRLHKKSGVFADSAVASFG